jgi:hypothetical protein
MDGAVTLKPLTTECGQAYSVQLGLSRVLGMNVPRTVRNTTWTRPNQENRLVQYLVSGLYLFSDFFLNTVRLKQRTFFR